MDVDVHEECLATFCLWPLHPGPCRGTTMRRNPRMAPGASHGRARVPAPAPAGQRPASGRARVGAPPAKGQGRAAVPPAKKAAPPAGNPERRVARARESNAGGAVLMLMGASSSVDGNRFADTVMADVRRAQQRDAQAGGSENYDQAVGRAAGQMARVLANERGGSPAERRHLENRIKRIAEEAMRSGNVTQLSALKRELARSRTASASPDILALYGLQLENGFHLWGDSAPALVASSFGSLAHLDCNLAVFCRNPLHPGPCKGWKGTLAKVAPGTLKLIEEERKKKLAAKQAAKAKAQAAAKKIVDQAKRGEEVDAHPAAKKKLAAKATAQILGDDEEKVTAIEGKTKLSKKEIAWHAQKKAAALLAMNLAAGNLKGSKAAQAKYRAYVRQALAEALEKDNESGATGPDSEYQKRLAVLTQAMSSSHADKFVTGDGEPEAELHAAVAQAFDTAMQADLANQKPGVDHPNLKKLTKALDAIHGEPGDAEHDMAVAEAVGLEGWEPSPNAVAAPDTPAADAPTPKPKVDYSKTPLDEAGAAQYGDTIAGVAAAMGGTPEAQAAGKANVAKMMNGKAPSDTPQLQGLVSKMAIHAGQTIAGKGTLLGTGAAAQIQDRVQAEMKQMLAEGLTEPPPGGILAAMKSGLKGEDLEKAVIGILKKDGVGVALKPAGIKWDEENPNGVAGPSAEPAPALPEGALSDEDAEKLSKGAEQVALLTGSPESAAKGAANAKKLAQSEGFTDQQTTMTMKTATNQASVAASQNYEGLDGFSPQGKKKFEKVLAAEMVEMLETGGSPKPGSLAELVAMKKAGLLSADEFHEQAMKKLKIKSKKLNPDGSSKTAAPPPPSAPAAGGAGAGGSLGKSQGGAASQIAQAIGGSASDNGAFVGQMLDNPSLSDEDKAGLINAEAFGLAGTLMDGLPLQSLNADEKKALSDTLTGLFDAAITNPGSAVAATNVVKALKAKNGPEMKAWAGALVPGYKKAAGGDGGGSSAPSAPKKATPEKVTKTLPKIYKLAGQSEDEGQEMAKIVNGGNDLDDEIDSEAHALATGVIAEANDLYYDLPDSQKQALEKKAKQAVKDSLASGDSGPVEEFQKEIAGLNTAQLADKANEPEIKISQATEVPDAASGPGTPVGTTADPGAEAAKITAGLQAAYEKLTGDDGSALSSYGAQAVLADAIKSGASPQEKAKQAAAALALQIVAAKIQGKTGMPVLHQKALVAKLAEEIEAGILSGNMDGEYIKSLSSSKGGFTKIKIKAKQAYEKFGAGPPPKAGASPLLPTSSKDAALDKALDDAFGPGGGSSAPKMPAEVNDNLVDHAAQMKGVPQSIQAKLNNLADAYNAASPADKPAAADALSQELAATALGNLMDQLNLLGNPMIDAPEVQKMIGKHLDQVKADYLAALNAGADAPGGLAGAIGPAIQHTQQLADDLAAENAYAPDGPAVSLYKVNTVSAMLDLAASTNASAPATTNPGGGAGAGGSGTGAVPVATPTPTVGPAGTGTQKPKVNVAALPKGTATYTAPTAPAPPPTATASTLKKPKAKKALPPLKPLPPAGPAPDLAGAKKVGGQGGSNPGAQYETDDGTRYYVKQQKSAAHARNEAMASALYREAGVETPPVTVQDGTVGELSGTLTTSQMVPGATPLPSKPTAAQLRAIRRGFAVDAWLGNWDVAGLSSDNIILDANGNPVRIDLGGSLEYRAQGSPKGAAFGDTVGEIDSLRSSTNPSANKLFGGMSDDELIDAMEQVEQIDPQRVRDIVAAQGGDPELAEKLIRRRQDILDRLKKLREAKEYAEKNTTALGVPDASVDAGKLKLGGEPKKQLILKAQKPSKVNQVVLEGHEGEVYEFNERVANSRNWTNGAQDVPVQMGSFGKTTPGYKSLHNYTSSAGCSQINGHLRAGGQPSPDPGDSYTSAADRVAQLDAVFEQARLAEPITVLRGFRGDSEIFGDLWTQHRDRNWAGAEFRDLAYSSSTVSEGTACGFAGCGSQNAVVIRVHMPAGTRAINLGGNSMYPGEAEILLNRGARFRIVADNGYQNGARQLDVEVICDGDGCADTA